MKTTYTKTLRTLLADGFCLANYTGDGRVCFRRHSDGAIRVVRLSTGRILESR